MKRLPAMQLWPPFTMRAVAATLAAASTSTSSRMTYASEPPSSSTHFFSTEPAAVATLRPAATLPVSVTAATLSSLIRASTSLLGRSSGPEQVTGHAGFMKHFLNRERAAGHIARMLQKRSVASHQRRRGKAEDLPEGEVPRHHREHDADRVEGDERFFAAEIHGLVGEICRRVVGEPVAVKGAFFDFGEAVGDGLAHLLGH